MGVKVVGVRGVVNDDDVKLRTASDVVVSDVDAEVRALAAVPMEDAVGELTVGPGVITEDDEERDSPSPGHWDTVARQ